MTNHLKDFGDAGADDKASPNISRSESAGGEKMWTAARIEKPPIQVRIFRFFLMDLPYLGMLGMALLGIGLVSFTGRSFSLYWEILTPIYGLMCVVAGWPHARDGDERFRLIWTQTLHWLAFLAAMYLVTSSDVRSIENNNAAGLNLMTILALGAFVAGVHAEAWQVCVVGALLALAVPAVAWIEQSALLFVLIAVLAVFVSGSFWWAVHMERRKSSRVE